MRRHHIVAALETAVSSDSHGASSSRGFSAGKSAGGSNKSPSHASSGEGRSRSPTQMRPSPARGRQNADMHAASSSPGFMFGQSTGGSNQTPMHASIGEGSRSTESRKRPSPSTDPSEGYAQDINAAGSIYSLVYVIGA